MNDLAVAEKQNAQVPVVKNITFDKGIVPKDYDDVMRLAGLMKTSGLAPKTLDTGQKIAIAMMMAMEIGMPIITGIQNIAVINGKAGIWGDAALAMVRKSGLLEVFKEWSEGKRKTSEWVFYCKIKRRGQEEVIGSYSWDEAKEAGFADPKMRDGKPDIYSPWTRFTNRMMQFKARNFPLRDQFGDVLRGMALVEDVQDAIDMEQVGETGTFRAPDASGIAPTPPTEKAIYTAEVIEEPPVGATSDNPNPETENNTSDDTITVSEFNRKKEAGYSTWVKENLARLKAAPQEIQDEAETQWYGFYSEVWPLGSDAEEDETEPDSATIFKQYSEQISQDTFNGLVNIHDISDIKTDPPSNVKAFFEDCEKEVKKG